MLDTIRVSDFLSGSICCIQFDADFCPLSHKNCCTNCFNFPNLTKWKSRIDAVKTKFLFLLVSHSWKYWFCWLKVLISRVQLHNPSSEEAWSIKSSFIIHILLISTEMEGRPVLRLHYVRYIKSREIRKWENPERQEPEVQYRRCSYPLKYKNILLYRINSLLLHIMTKPLHWWALKWGKNKAPSICWFFIFSQFSLSLRTLCDSVSSIMAQCGTTF